MNASLSRVAAFAQDAFAPRGRRRGAAGRRGAGVAVALPEGARRLLARNTPVRRAAADPMRIPELLGADVHRLSADRAGISQIPRRPRLFLGPDAAHPAGLSRARSARWAISSMTRSNYQHRVGFDAWEVPDDFTLEMFNRALTEMTNVYQPSADGRKTIRELRATALTACCRNRNSARAEPEPQHEWRKFHPNRRLFSGVAGSSLPVELSAHFRTDIPCAKPLSPCSPRWRCAARRPPPGRHQCARADQRPQSR